MTVTLLHNTPLWVAAHAIRTCWSSQDKGDSKWSYICPRCNNTLATSEVESEYCDFCGYETNPVKSKFVVGDKDRALIDRVGNKYKHSSTLEHLVYTFDIQDVSRALLQELARHRIASLSVKSTRYTLKELKNESEFIVDLNEVVDKSLYSDWFINSNPNYSLSYDFKRASKYLVMTSNPDIDCNSVMALENLRGSLLDGISNDIAKYCLPEAYKTSLTWTINARSLQNFLTLRSDKAALWEIRDLASKIFQAIPSDHKYLFEYIFS